MQEKCSKMAINKYEANKRNKKRMTGRHHRRKKRNTILICFASVLFFINNLGIRNVFVLNYSNLEYASKLQSASAVATSIEEKQEE